MELFNGKVICPRCDGNGLIYQGRIEEINKSILICDECEAIWLDFKDIDNFKFQDLSTYLEANNCHYSSTEIIDQGYYWYK